MVHLLSSLTSSACAAAMVAGSKEDPVDTPWNLPFDLKSLPEDVAAKLVVIAPFLLGRKRANYDSQFFHRTLGLCNTGIPFSELSSDKLCKKSLFIETWPERLGGRHYIADCSDQQAIDAYTEQHAKVYGGEGPDNNTFGTSFLRGCHLTFELGKDVNWAQKAESLQKAREKGAARNPLKLTPPALREQIEAIIGVLAGHIDDKPSAGNTSLAIEGVGTQPSHGVFVTGSSSKGGPGVEGARGRTRSALKAKAALGSEEESLPKSSLAVSRYEDRPTSESKAKLDQAKTKKARAQADLAKKEAQREVILGDLRTSKAFLKEKEDEENRFYEDVAAHRAASIKARAAGNVEEKKRLDALARLGGDQMANASKAAQEAQLRIDNKEKQLAALVGDIEKSKAEVGVLSVEIMSFELAAAFIRPKSVLPHLPSEFRALPIQVSDPCPFCARYFVDAACVPLTCGCLAHPHCMFEVVFSLDAKCSRCCRSLSGGWLGQWGFPLHESAQAELHHLQELLKSEVGVPDFQSSFAGSKRAAKRTSLPSEEEDQVRKKTRFEEIEEASDPLVIAKTSAQPVVPAELLPAAVGDADGVANTQKSDDLSFLQVTQAPPREEAEDTCSHGGGLSGSATESGGTSSGPAGAALDKLVDAIATSAVP